LFLDELDFVGLLKLNQALKHLQNYLKIIRLRQFYMVININ